MKALRFVLAVFFGFIVLMIYISSRFEHIPDTGTSRKEIPLTNCPETYWDTLKTRFHRRAWRDNYYNTFCNTYQLKEESYQDALERRYHYEDYMAKDYIEFWGRLYQYLAKKDIKMLKPLLDSLKGLNDSNELDRDQFADVVVSMVQDIDYAYILSQEKCKDQVGNIENCLENERFGLLSPIEFLYTLRGDCDTRSVLLYALFKELGYSPKIAVSNAYRHAMLLLDITGPGTHLSHLGKKYYFWETTAKGWKAGYMPPITADVSKWEIALH